jgi:hypothetical protein
MRADPFLDPGILFPEINRGKDVSDTAFPGGDLTVDQHPVLVQTGIHPKSFGDIVFLGEKPGEIPWKRSGRKAIFGPVPELRLSPLFQFSSALSYHCVTVSTIP